MAKQINYQVNFQVNQSGLAQLQKELRAIQVDADRAKLSGTLTNDLQQASQAAKQLEVALNNAFNHKIGTLDVAKFNQEIKSSFGSVDQLKAKLEAVGKGDYFNRLAIEARSANQQIKVSNKLLDDMATTFKNTVRYGLSSSIFNGLANGIQQAFQYTKSLDTSLNDIRIVTDKSAQDMEKFAVQANRAAKALGSTTRDYTNGALIYYQQGLNDEETAARTEVTLKAANVTAQTGQEVSEQLTAIWNGYKVTAEETELYIDKVAKVAATSAADLEELATGMSKVASAANSAGVDIDQLNASLATVISVTREAPETIGSAFKTIYARLGDLALDGEDEYGVSLGKVTGQLDALGIKILEDNGEMREMGDIVEDIAAKWQTWTQAQRQAAAVAMAGKMQYSRLIALFDNWDKYEQYLSDSANATGTLNEQQAIYMESTAAHLNQLKTEWESLYDTVLDQDAINSLLDTVTGGLHLINNMLKGIGGGMSDLIFLGSALARVFQSQIAASIATTLNNMDATKKNKALGQNTDEWKNAGFSTPETKEEQQVQTQFNQNTQDLANATRGLTQERFNELNALKKEIAEESLLITKIEEQGNKVEGSAAILKKRAEMQEKFTKQEVANYTKIEKLLEKIGKTYSDNAKEAEESLNAEIELINLMQAYQDEGKGYYDGNSLLTKEQEVTYAQALAALQNDELLTQEQISVIEDAQLATVRENTRISNELTENARLQQQFEDGTLQILTRQRDARQQSFDAATQEAARQAAIQQTINSLSSLAMMLTTISGLWKTATNPDLSGMEKFEQITTTILMTLPFMITGFTSLTGLLPGMAVAFGAVGAAEDYTAMSALKATVSVLGFKMALWEVFLIGAVVVALIGGLVAAGAALADAYDKDANEANRAAEAAKELQSTYEETKQAAEDLKKEISDYHDAIDALDELTTGTDEYREALEKVNKQARELIENHKLFDKYKIENGVIKIDEDALKEVQNAANAAVDTTQNNAIISKIYSNRADITRQATDIRRKLGTVYSDTASGTSYDFWEGRQVSNETIEQIGEGLRNLKKDMADFDTVVKDDEAFKNMVLNIDSSNDAIRLQINSIVKNKDALLQFANSLDDTSKANKYYAEQIMDQAIRNKYGKDVEDIATDKNGEVNNAAMESAIAAIKKNEEDHTNEINKKIEESSKGISDINGNGDYRKWLEKNGLKNTKWDNNDDWSGDDDKVIAGLYAMNVVKPGLGWNDITYQEDHWGHGTIIENSTGQKIVDNVDDKAMRRGLAQAAVAEKVAKEAGDVLNEEQFLKTAKKLREAQNAMDTEADFFTSFMNKVAAGKDAKLDLSNTFAEIDPTQFQQYKNLSADQLKEMFGLNDEDLKNLGFNSAEEFQKGFSEAMEKYDASGYITQSQNRAATAQNVLDTLSKGNLEKLQKKELEELNEEIASLEKRYEDLGDIQDKTSHEYLQRLREIKEYEETNAMNGLEWQREKLQKDLDDMLDHWDDYEKELKQKFENGELSEEEMNVKLVARTEEIEETLQKLEDTDHKIKLQIDADLASDVSDAFGLAEELDQLKDKVSEDLEYTYEEAQKLIDAGYGAMFEMAQETANATIKVNKDVMNAFIDDKQAELDADKDSKIAQLENQKVMLNAQKAALQNKLAALQEAAGAETEVDAQTSLAKVQNAEAEYEAATDALNQSLKDEAEGATETQNINADLYNALGGMYEEDEKNESNAEKVATDTQAQNIKTRIENVRQLNEAYRGLARQVKASENGEDLGPLSTGGVSGGTTGSGTSSSNISANNQTANTVEKKQLNLKGMFDENGATKQYKDTINALIKSTQAQIKAIDGQIGAADAGIAALKSAGKTLDERQRTAGTDKKSGSGSKEKDPDQKDLIEDEKDRYHDINIILKQINTELQRTQKLQDKLFGKDLINNLNKQLGLLDKQIDATNKKINIAIGEAAELRGTLSLKGVRFNDDGTIANYADAYNAQLNYVNSVIQQYNAMSAEEQESYKKVVEQAEKDFNNFVKIMQNYDKLISETIPGLQDEITEAAYKQIEIKITKFDMEMEIRLDLKNAEKEWNEFRKKVIQQIRDDDILGNARASLRDFDAYYKNDGTGIIQRNTQHINDILGELRKMDAGQISDVYGTKDAQGNIVNDRKSALEDLQKYYQQMMKDLQEVEELREEMHQKHLEMMDEAADKFAEQVEMYEHVGDLIEHDLKLIEMVEGEKAYDKMAKYYEKQVDNNMKALDFATKQKDFWKSEMDAAEQEANMMKARRDALTEGTDEWEAANAEYRKAIEIFDSAKEKWLDAIDEWQDKTEAAVEAVQDKYLNTINEIFKNLNNKVTNGMGLDYVEEEWGLINKQSDEYLDTINAIYGVQKLQNKYLDALDDTDSISGQRKLNDLMNEEISALQAKDKLTQYDLDRAELRYQIALKQIALEEAQQNKSQLRLRRDSQGNYSYQYVADDSETGALREEISDLYNQLYNLDLDKYRENLNNIYDLWVEYQEKMYEAAQINDPEERAAREALLYEQYGSLINGMVEQNEQVRQGLYESTFLELKDFYDNDEDAFKNTLGNKFEGMEGVIEKAKDSAEDLSDTSTTAFDRMVGANLGAFENMAGGMADIIMDEILPEWTSGVQQMADEFAGEGGFGPTVDGAMQEVKDTTEQYEQELEEVWDTAGIVWDDVVNGTDNAIDEVEALIEENDDLIDSYDEQLRAIEKIETELDNLIFKYNQARDAAIAATKAAYEYWQEQERQAAAEAAKEAAKMTGGNSGGSGGGGGSSSGGSGGGSGSGGDGVARVGDVVTFTGKYYYDSWGTTPAGSRYSGQQGGVVIDSYSSSKYGGKASKTGNYDVHIKSADGKYPDLGWVKLSQLSGYATGGYTGDWAGNDGRLALLHKKELILNAGDTQNMLGALNVLRAIVDSVGSSMLSRMAGLTGIGASGADVDAAAETIEQNVHIEASFPGVQNSREIENAFNNLVNIAAQRTHRK